MKISETIKQECIQLRVKEHKSLSQIEKQMRVSRSTLSIWLRDFPLTKDERYKRIGVDNHTQYRAPFEKIGSLFIQANPEGMSRLQKSKIAEAAVFLRLVVFGFCPFGSVFDGDKTDWLVEVPDSDKVHKVQVKWARRNASGGLPYISFRCRQGSETRPYEKGDFDFIVGYDYHSDQACVWAWDEVKSHKRVVTMEESAIEAWDKMKEPQVTRS